VPSPITGDLERIKLWLQVCTGLKLANSHTTVLELDAATWEEHRRRLEEQGGPP
jgi:hypothetical protein